MTNFCLKQQLKESVDNTNILYIGEEAIPVEVPNNGNLCRCIIEYSENSKIRIIGDGNFLDSSGNVLANPKSIDIAANTMTWIYLSPGTYSIVIAKYYIKYITSMNNKAIIDFKETDFNKVFKYSHSLTSMDFGYVNNLGINLNDFLDKNTYPNIMEVSTSGMMSSCNVLLDLDLIDSTKSQKIKSLNLSTNIIDETKLKGDIANVPFVIIKNSSMIFLRNSVINGELDSVLDQLVTDGNTGTVQFYGNGIVTLNSNIIAKGTNVSISVTPNGWSINN